MFVYMGVCIYVCICKVFYLCIYECIYVIFNLYMYVCIYVSMLTGKCICVCLRLLHACMYVCEYIYIIYINECNDVILCIYA